MSLSKKEEEEKRVKLTPKNQILLHQRLSVEEVGELDDGMPRVVGVVGVSAGRLGIVVLGDVELVSRKGLGLEQVIALLDREMHTGSSSRRVNLETSRLVELVLGILVLDDVADLSVGRPVLQSRAKARSKLEDRTLSLSCDFDSRASRRPRFGAWIGRASWSIE